MKKRFNFKRAAFIIGVTALAIFLSIKASEKTWLFILIWVIWFIIMSFAVLTDAAEDAEREMEGELRYCPECKKKTRQFIALYHPDYPELGAVWQCSICKENVGFVE